MSNNGTKITTPRETLQINPYFSELLQANLPYVEPVTYTVEITDDKGAVYFRQPNVEAPAGWSYNAVKVVASKYFRGQIGSPDRESSVFDVVGRVVRNIAQWAIPYIGEHQVGVYEEELRALILLQHMAFNSPVWFNVGVEKYPQCSACFINSVEDTLESILDLAKVEGMLFKFGSGTGTNLSSIRSSKEGFASGPVSFMRGFDAFAGVIKSGGKTRRAAKMCILNIEHPDAPAFIQCKAREERKAHALIDAGYDGSFNGEAYQSIFFQNSNNSVRVSDRFMEAVVEDASWETNYVTTGKVCSTYQARELFRMIAQATYDCGDPGLQFDDTINGWHTCMVSGRIRASNPCSEYMFLDDSACNLASLNLRKFQNDDGTLKIDAFHRAVELTILAQEAIVSRSSYPTPKIKENSERYRPLGLGYANLGAFLMARGIAYDSVEGRSIGACITAIMTGDAYHTSAQLASIAGPFEGYEENRSDFICVMKRHRECVESIQGPVDSDVYNMRSAARMIWDEVLTLGRRYGFRNSQATVLAPTGTIGFMMDCDTTGIEPDIALVKYKQLVGGGSLKIVNQSVQQALQSLGYHPESIDMILEYLEKYDTVESIVESGVESPVAEDHLKVFDCAFRARNGRRSISVEGHIEMMAACQPFLSGAISKTVNLPNDATVEDVERAYMMAWKLGLKAVAIYRDGCKRSQPLSTSKEQAKEQPITYKEIAPERRWGERRRLPQKRQGTTTKLNLVGHEGLLTVNFYDDGSVGEIIVRIHKEGSTVGGLVDAWATAVSMALQVGWPLQAVIEKFRHWRFEPSGLTSGDADVRGASSFIDYIAQHLELVQSSGSLYYRGAEQATLARRDLTVDTLKVEHRTETFQTGDPCLECGHLTVRQGRCLKCINCGSLGACG